MGHTLGTLSLALGQIVILMFCVWYLASSDVFHKFHMKFDIWSAGQYYGSTYHNMFFISDIRSLIYNIFCMIFDIFCVIFDMLHMTFDNFCMIFDIFCMIFEMWYMMFVLLDRSKVAPAALCSLNFDSPPLSSSFRDDAARIWTVAIFDICWLLKFIFVAWYLKYYSMIFVKWILIHRHFSSSLVMRQKFGQYLIFADYQSIHLLHYIWNITLRYLSNEFWFTATFLLLLWWCGKNLDGGDIWYLLIINFDFIIDKSLIIFNKKIT